MSDQFLILGHRGSPTRFRENTIESFEEALRCGADGFETDLRLLSDGIPVLYHDDEIDERACETYRFDELEKVEQVRVLERFAGRARMCLEVKRSKWEDVLLETVSKWPGIVIASFDHSLIAELHRRKCGLPLGLTFFGYPVDLADYAERLGATWLYPQYRYVDAEMVEAAHARGIRVMPWTANRPRDWDRLREAGCDGVITDFPAEAVEWRRGVRPSRPQ
jgi:glycerophosphoryl diester phosphodiesterase